MRMEFYNTKEHRLDFHMVNCGYEDSPPHFMCPPHFRGFYLIHYVARGAGVYEVKGERYRLSAGDIFIIYPNELVSYYCPDAEKPWSLYWLGFGGAMASHFLAETGLKGYTATGKNQQFGAVIMNCLSYVEKHKGETISSLKLSSYVLDALHCLSAPTHSRRLSSAAQAERALHYIEYNYMNDISTRDVAEYLSLERSYVYRLFKTHLGCSPEQYIARYRMQKAVEMIRLGRYSMTEIARFVGMKDIFYFSRVFKKILGISPTDFEKDRERLGPLEHMSPHGNEPKKQILR